MASADADRWNERYRRGWYSVNSPPPTILVDHADLLPARGIALDLAMGLGSASGFLLERGLQVVGVDISAVAVAHAKARLPSLWAVVANASRFYLPSAAFNVICNFYFLDRSLWPVYRSALRPGGLLFIETLTREMLVQKPEIDPQYLLETGELRQAFQDWPILYCDEHWTSTEHGAPLPVASLVACKPI